MGTQPHPGETRVRGLVHRELVKPWHQRCEQMKPRKIKMKDDLAALGFLAMYLPDSFHHLLVFTATGQLSIEHAQPRLEALFRQLPPQAGLEATAKKSLARLSRGLAEHPDDIVEVIAWVPETVAHSWRDRCWGVKPRRIDLEDDIAGMILLGLWLPDAVHWVLVHAAAGELPAEQVQPIMEQIRNIVPDPKPQTT